MKEILDQSETKKLIEQVLAEATQQGASAAEASISIGKGLSISVRLGEIDTIEHHRNKSISLSVYFGQRVGHVSSADFNPGALKEAVAKACNIAKYTQEDSAAGLAAPELLAFNYPDLDLYHHWNISEQQGIQLALELEKLTLAQNKKITNSEGTTVNTGDDFHVYGNTLGFLGDFFTSRHTLSVAVIADDGHEMQREYDYTTARDPQDLEEITSVAKRLADRTVSRLGARKLSTRTCPVIFSHEMARGFWGHLISAISGSAIYRKTSFLLDQLDQPIFPAYVHISEQPHLVKAIGSSPFDSDGIRTVPKDIIHAGTLATYLLSVYSARKLGMKPTGNGGGIYNLIVESQPLDFKQLLQKMDTGLLVTELIGQGVNIVTGDYSRGAFGYWVEGGVIQYPVQEITIAGNLKDMFNNVIAVSNDVDLRGNVRTGSVLLAEMTVAGQ